MSANRRSIDISGGYVVDIDTSPHFHDAVAAMWVEGELVHLEDLVFRDAEMDQRTATHELTLAHAIVRARRHIQSRARDCALGREGRCDLTGRGGVPAALVESDREGQGEASVAEAADPWRETEADHLAEEFAEIDAVLGTIVPAARRRGRSS